VADDFSRIFSEKAPILPAAAVLTIGLAFAIWKGMTPSPKFSVPRYVPILVVLIIASASSWVQAVSTSLLNARLNPSIDLSASEPLMLLLLATVMAISARQLRRRSSN